MARQPEKDADQGPVVSADTLRTRARLRLQPRLDHPQWTSGGRAYGACRGGRE